MKGKPLKRLEDEWVQCLPEECTHLEIKRPGPAGTCRLPVLVGMSKTREGTNCWSWNGDTDNPTIKPSILTTWTWWDMDNITEEDWGPWETKPDGTRFKQVKPESRHKMKETQIVCHTWITDGMVQFLGDCTHQFAGQILDLLDVD